MVLANVPKLAHSNGSKTAYSDDYNT